MTLQAAELQNDLTRVLMTMTPDELEELAKNIAAFAAGIRFGGRGLNLPAHASFIAGFLASRVMG